MTSEQKMSSSFTFTLYLPLLTLAKFLLIWGTELGVLKVFFIHKLGMHTQYNALQVTLVIVLASLKFM